MGRGTTTAHLRCHRFHDLACNSRARYKFTYIHCECGDSAEPRANNNTASSRAHQQYSQSRVSHRRVTNVRKTRSATRRIRAHQLLVRLQLYLTLYVCMCLSHASKLMADWRWWLACATTRQRSCQHFGRQHAPASFFFFSSSSSSLLLL